jgi:hypothetical protein
MATSGTLRAAVLAAAAACADAQVTWHQQATTGAPPARLAHSISNDPSGRILLFGGSSVSALLDDTWVLDGQTWQLLAPAHQPAARLGHGLAFDLNRNRVVLFGGISASGVLNDTWEWDGADWTRIATAAAPSARFWFGMTFDVLLGETVLFGGAGQVTFDDTWTWNGIAWRQVQSATRPPARWGPALACDLTHSNMLLFGGLGANTLDLGDTWTFDGSNWTLRAPAHSPPPRLLPNTMVPDLGRGRVILFGGRLAGGDGADTWEWDGADWAQRLPNGTSPSPREGGACEYDLVRGRVVLFGGNIHYSGLPFADTWVYGPDPPPATGVFGTGCGGARGVPQLSARPAAIGGSLQMFLSALPNGPLAAVMLGTSRTIWGTTPLPFDLAPYGMPGCRLLARPDAVVLLPATGGFAAQSTPVPANSALAGLRLYAQAVGFDAAANPGGAVLSNGLEVLIGGG